MGSKEENTVWKSWTRVLIFIKQYLKCPRTPIVYVNKTKISREKDRILDTKLMSEVSFQRDLERDLGRYEDRKFSQLIFSVYLLKLSQM